ncbi:acyl-CoA dehydrogenase family protein [Sphingopyxis sp.]|uniref:acyl-CoA dehydrogenase family protein n=1 Tax=Sphingopyxis sp. TaxID=1908224 RepID=UPI003D0F3B79
MDAKESNGGWSTALGPTHREMLDQADRFARSELAPLARRMDDEEWWPDTAFRGLAAHGYLGLTAAEAYGGAGLDIFAAGLVAQAFARWNHAFALSWVVHENLCLNNIEANADDEQRARFIPKLTSGEWIGALGLTEPGAGSDALGSMRTTAVRDGDDYILNGTKLYITNGPVADVVLVYAKTDPAARQRGISAFVVPTNSPGFKVAQKLVKMGYRGSQTAELVLEDCRVPAANRLRGENDGIAVVMSGLDLERAMIAPICLGICERALELTIEHAKTRQQFGKPIAEFQLVQAHIADMYVAIETMRGFTWQVLAECTKIAGGEGGRGRIHALTAASVHYAAETANRVLDHAVQVHGGAGYIWESEINRLFRSTKLMEIGAGTTEVRKLIIAGELLR